MKLSPPCYSRLHGHAIFGVVSVSDTFQTPERVRLAGYRCPTSVLFSFFFFRFSDTRRRGADTAPTRPTRQQWRKKGRISQILRNPPLKFSTHPPSDLCRCPLSLAEARSGRSASSIGVEWRRALSLSMISLSRHGQQVQPPLFVPRRSKIWLIGELHRRRVTPCPVPSDDLSLSRRGQQVRPPSVFFFFFPSDFGDWMVMGLLLTYITVTL